MSEKTTKAILDIARKLIPDYTFGFFQVLVQDPVYDDWLTPMERTLGAAVPELCNTPIDSRFITESLSRAKISDHRTVAGMTVEAYHIRLTQYSRADVWSHSAKENGDAACHAIYDNVVGRERLRSLVILKITEQDTKKGLGYILVGSRQRQQLTISLHRLTLDDAAEIVKSFEAGLASLLTRWQKWQGGHHGVGLLGMSLDLSLQPLGASVDRKKLIDVACRYLVGMGWTDRVVDNAVLSIFLYRFMPDGCSTRQLSKIASTRLRDWMIHGGNQNVGDGGRGDDSMTRFVAETGRMAYIPYSDYVNPGLEITSEEMMRVTLSESQAYTCSDETDTHEHRVLCKTVLEVDSLIASGTGVLESDLRTRASARMTWVRAMQSFDAILNTAACRISVPINICGQTVGAAELTVRCQDSQPMPYAIDRIVMSSMRAVADVVGALILQYHKSILLQRLNTTVERTFRSGNRKRAFQHLNEFAASVRKVSLTDAVSIVTIDPKELRRSRQDRLIRGAAFRIAGTTRSVLSDSPDSIRSTGWTNFLWNAPQRSTIGLVLKPGQSENEVPLCCQIEEVGGHISIVDIPRDEIHRLRFNRMVNKLNNRLQIGFRVLDETRNPDHSPESSALVWFSFIARGGTYFARNSEQMSGFERHIRHLYGISKMCSVVSQIAESRERLQSSFYMISRHEGMGQLIESASSDIAIVSSQLSRAGENEILCDKLNDATRALNYIVSKLDSLREVPATESEISLGQLASIHAEPVVLAEILTDSWRLAQRIYPRSYASVVFDIDRSFRICTPVSFMHVMLVNILINAFRCAKDHADMSELIMSMTVRKAAGGIVLVVKDNGKGMDEGKLSAMQNAQYMAELASGLGANRSSGVGTILIARLAIAVSNGSAHSLKVYNHHDGGLCYEIFIFDFGAHR